MLEPRGQSHRGRGSSSSVHLQSSVLLIWEMATTTIGCWFLDHPLSVVKPSKSINLQGEIQVYLIQHANNHGIVELDRFGALLLPPFPCILLLHTCPQLSLRCSRSLHHWTPSVSSTHLFSFWLLAWMLLFSWVDLGSELIDALKFRVFRRFKRLWHF